GWDEGREGRGFAVRRSFSAGRTETGDPGRARVEVSPAALAVLAGCVLLALELPLHAYLRQTREPWGQLTLPLVLLVSFSGLVVTLWFIARPSGSWPIFARLIGLTGLVLLVCGILSFVSIGIDLPVRQTPSEQKATCLARMKEAATALLRGCVKINSFPAGENWMQIVRENVDTGRRYADMLVCPSARGPHRGYAFNKELSRKALSAERAGSLVMLFESDYGENAAGGPELLPDVPRHRGGDNYGFADGHVQWLPRKKNPDGSWAKEPDADWVIWEPVVKEGEGERPPP
ncbi:MAG TPA: hypothetical protein VM537_20860, partial [Anaerolineae bacterium]|nr:hypothetical protein [Anaerolineae bacterium]